MPQSAKLVIFAESAKDQQDEVLVIESTYTLVVKLSCNFIMFSILSEPLFYAFS